MRGGLVLVLLALALPPGAAAVAPPAGLALLLSAAGSARTGERVVFQGRLLPPHAQVPVGVYKGNSLLARGTTRADGSFTASARVVTPGPYRARWGALVSKPVRVLIRPVLQAALVGLRIVGKPLTLVAGLEPPTAGPIRVRVVRGERQTFVGLFYGHARVQLATPGPERLSIDLATFARDGYAPRSTTLHTSVSFPSLRLGEADPAVAVLTRRLAELHYAVPAPDPFYRSALVDAVYAFQKVQGLPRTGVVDAATWGQLGQPDIPSPRYPSPADHIEIDKTHQVLYDVRGGRIARILPVSTAGVRGYYTPNGQFAIYRKVSGFDPSPLGVLYDPVYFVAGYAIHGNPSVPPYPASHGCIRIPMWLAPAFYAEHGYGETVYVY